GRAHRGHVGGGRPRDDRVLRDHPVPPVHLLGPRADRLGRDALPGAQGRPLTAGSRPLDARRPGPGPGPGLASLSAAKRHFATAFFSSEPALSLTPKFAGIEISSPVRGLRPVRAARSTRSAERKPVTLTASPLASDSISTSWKALSAASASDLLISALAAMAETSSDLLSDMRFPSSVTSCGGTRPTTRPHTASRSAGIRGERAFRRRVVGNFPLSEDTSLWT